MKVKFANKEFELLNGEYRRYVEENGTHSAEYLCVGLCDDNKVLFQYIDTMGEVKDFIQCIIDNIPQFALDYLTDILSKNNNILARITLFPTMPTGFEIYYNCNCKNDDVDSIIQWMGDNNDFAATEYRYTEVINGHQKCVGN